MDFVWAFLVAAALIAAVITWMRGEHSKRNMRRIAERSKSTVSRPTDLGGQIQMTTSDSPTPPPPPSSGEKSDSERKQILANAVANALAQPGKWRVESQADFNAILVKGTRVNHVLHLILTLVTIGFWLIVWIGLVVLGGEKRYQLTVDAFGNTNISKL